MLSVARRWGIGQKIYTPELGADVPEIATLLPLYSNVTGVSPGTQSQDTSSYKTPRVVS